VADDFKPGDPVEWNSHGGKKSGRGRAVGRIVRKLTRTTKIKGHTARATPDDPQYLVRSDRSGGEAAHEPGALRRRRKG
jgi:hypothetical protein